MTDNSLVLVVEKKTIGELTTNAVDLKNKLQAMLQGKMEDYKGDATQAKKDRAEVNNAAKKINDQFIAIKKDFMRPLEQLEATKKEIANMMTQVSEKLGAIVKAKEDQEKLEKLKSIKALWGDVAGDLCKDVAFEKIFNQKWLNKTCKDSDIMADMQEQATKINSDIKSIQALTDDTETLLEVYYRSMNLSEVLELARARAESKKRKEEQEKQEQQRLKEMQQAKEVRGERQNADDTNGLNFQAGNDTSNDAFAGVVNRETVETKDEVKQPYTLYIYGNEIETTQDILDYARSIGVFPYWRLYSLNVTLEECKKIKAYMTKENMPYKKIEPYLQITASNKTFILKV